VPYGRPTHRRHDEADVCFSHLLSESAWKGTSVALTTVQSLTGCLDTKGSSNDVSVRNVHGSTETS